jgi:hypothetical protein
VTFKRGVSGNPAGRARGSRNKAMAMLDKIGADSAGDVLRAVVEAARGGDMAAASLLLSRAWPARRGRPVVVEMPAITTAADVTLALSAITAAVAEGRLTTTEAAELATLIESVRKSIETVEIEERLRRIEERLKR